MMHGLRNLSSGSAGIRQGCSGRALPTHRRLEAVMVGGERLEGSLNLGGTNKSLARLTIPRCMTLHRIVYGRVRQRMYDVEKRM